MKPFSGNCCISIAIVVLVAVSVIFTGCTQPAGQQTTLTPTSPGGNTGQVTPAPASTPVTSSLPYGVTISVPAGWTRQDALASSTKDYGTSTVNIANFFSPAAIPGDPASYVTLGVDVDPSPGSDFEKYFNDATLAVGKLYGVPSQFEAHSYTIMISGYKSYELDFQTLEVKGTYIFTSTENGMYIFSFKVPNKPRAVQVFQESIVDIYKSIRINPPPTVVPTPHR